MGEVTIRSQHPDEAGVLVECRAQRSIQFMAFGTEVTAAVRTPRDIVAGDTVLVWKESGHQRGERRTANRRRDVTAIEEKAAACELVQMGRLDVGVTHEAVVAPRLIVTEDEDNVRRVCGEGVADYEQKQGGQ